MRCAHIFAIALAVSAGSSSVAVAAETTDLEVVARNVVRELVDGKYDAAVARFSPELRKTMGRDQLAILLDGIRGERSPARSVIARLRHDEADGNVLFTVKGNWSRGAASDFKVRLAPDGTVLSVALGDEAHANDSMGPAARERYETKNKLRPPFHGTFTARAASLGPLPLAYAFAWVMLGADGKSHRGEGKKNDDYLAWGQAVVAPAAGQVVTAIDGIPDNAPGATNGLYAPGNAVVIDLGQGEFAMLLHLAEGSVAVKAGQRVQAGEVIAKVGSSGAIAEPGLVFVLADGAKIGVAHALPAKFSGAILDGKRVDRGAAKEGARLAE